MKIIELYRKGLSLEHQLVTDIALDKYFLRKVGMASRMSEKILVVWEPCEKMSQSRQS